MPNLSFLPYGEYPFKIFIAERAYLAMYHYTRLWDKELGGLLKVDYADGEWLIEDAILLPQKVNTVHFSINNEGMIDFISQLPKEEYHKWKGWWHSHANMHVLWSDEDISTFKHLNNIMKDMIGIVLNKRREFSILIAKDNQWYEKKDFEIIPDEIDIKKYKQDIKDNVKNENIFSKLIGTMRRC